MGNVSDVLLKLQNIVNQYNTKELKPNRQEHERHARTSERENTKTPIEDVF